MAVMSKGFGQFLNTFANHVQSINYCSEWTTPQDIVQSNMNHDNGDVWWQRVKASTKDKRRVVNHMWQRDCVRLPSVASDKQKD